MEGASYSDVDQFGEESHPGRVTLEPGTQQALRLFLSQPEILGGKLSGIQQGSSSQAGEANEAESEGTMNRWGHKDLWWVVLRRLEEWTGAGYKVALEPGCSPLGTVHCCVRKPSCGTFLDHVDLSPVGQFCTQRGCCLADFTGWFLPLSSKRGPSHRSCLKSLHREWSQGCIQMHPSL